MNVEMAEAIVKASAQLSNLPKTSTARIPTKSGGSFEFSYAPLPDVLDAVKPVLAEYGLALLQHAGGQDGRVSISTLLLHESGDIHDAGSVALPAGSTMEAGAVFTYLRRYAICALFGIAADDDVDAPVSVQDGTTSPPAGKTDAAQGAGEDSAKASPASTKYPVDPSKCSHKYPSGNWLPWDDQDRCPKCGTAQLVAMESGGPYG